jgi:hypothetical protein
VFPPPYFGAIGLRNCKYRKQNAKMRRAEGVSPLCPLKCGSYGARNVGDTARPRRLPTSYGESRSPSAARQKGSCACCVGHGVGRASDQPAREWRNSAGPCQTVRVIHGVGRRGCGDPPKGGPETSGRGPGELLIWTISSLPQLRPVSQEPISSRGDFCARARRRAALAQPRNTRAMPCASRREAVFAAVEAYSRTRPVAPYPARPPGCWRSCSPPRTSAA